MAAPDPADTPESSALRRWLLLGVGSLLLAGLLSALLVVARAPLISTLVTDPAFFRRCLVVHVDLSLLVWLYAFAAGLSFLLPRAGRSSLRSRLAVWIGGVGILSMLLAAGAPGAAPVLANYVPVIDHWLFTGGLVVFAVAVLLAICDRRLLASENAPGSILPIPAAAVPGLRALGIAIVLAALTFLAAWADRPLGLDAATRYELGNWGGGHVLQLASSIAMVSVWLILLNGVLGRAPLRRQTAAAGFGLLIAPWAAAPVLALRGMQDVAARDAFTLLMRWAIFPIVGAFLYACLRAVLRGFGDGTLTRRSLRDPRLLGFFASAALTVLGWILGALITGSTTMIPAHYHAAIGGVTVAFMAASYPLLEATGIRVRASRFGERAVAWQPVLFGIGQSIFAIGFALAGAQGMGRKLYGAEQRARSAAEVAGLGIMGLGGLVAIAGGLLFLYLVVAAWLRREQARASAPLLLEPAAAFASPRSTHRTGGHHG